MLSVSLMLGQIYGFPEHEYSERMTGLCECGFDYRQASAVRAECGMLLARFVRCVLNAHPKILA